MAALNIGIFKRAFMFPFRNFGALLRIGMIPALIVLAVIYVIFASIAPHLSVPTTPEDDMRRLMQVMSWVTIPLQILYVVIASIFAVGIHRLIIRGEYPSWVIFRFGRYELAYAAMLVFFILLYVVEQYAFLGTGWALGMIPAQLLKPYPDNPQAMMTAYRQIMTPELLVLLLAAGAVSLWINVRLSLSLAHAAVTGELSLALSWRAMRGNFWRLAIASLILFVIVAITYFVVGTLVAIAGTAIWIAAYGPPQPPEPNASFSSALDTMFWVYVVLVPVMGFFASMFIALLSYAYKELVEQRDADSGY